MYGLVNRAVQDLVQSRFGDEAWANIKRRAGIDVTAFLSMQTYDDALTYALVEAATRELGASTEAVLELFGEHWVDYAARHGYRAMMRVKGQSLFEFIARLDDLHARLSLTFPDLQPPSFRTVREADDRLRLHYHSSRPGLAPMVTGLIRGLGKLFEVDVTVSHERRRSDACDHDEFIVCCPSERSA